MNYQDKVKELLDDPEFVSAYIEMVEHFARQRRASFSKEDSGIFVAGAIPLFLMPYTIDELETKDIDLPGTVPFRWTIGAMVGRGPLPEDAEQEQEVFD